MAHVRDSARTYGKSDPIDALAIARAVQREADLAVARLDGPDREVRLLTDHRESLVNERTRAICRLRWFLHELDPSWEPKPRSLDRISVLQQVAARLVGANGTVGRLARELVERIRVLTLDIDDLTNEITTMVATMTPTLLAIPGCGALTRRQNSRRDRWRRPVQVKGCLHSTQRHCAHASLVIEQGTAPAQPNRESPAQHGTASHGADPSSLASASQGNDGAA
jgi:transposase